jgi:hypothetical protein
MKINEKSLKKLGLKLINIRKKSSKKVLPVLERTANSNASQQQVKSFQSLQNIPSSSVIIPPNINSLSSEIAREQLRYYENLNNNTPFVPNTNKLREQLEENRINFRDQVSPIINNDDYYNRAFTDISDIPKQDAITSQQKLELSEMPPSLDDIPLKSGDDNLNDSEIRKIKITGMKIFYKYYLNRIQAPTELLRDDFEFLYGQRPSLNMTRAQLQTAIKKALKNDK